jgi:Caspase domain
MRSQVRCVSSPSAAMEWGASYRHPGLPMRWHGSRWMLALLIGLGLIGDAVAQNVLAPAPRLIALLIGNHAYQAPSTDDALGLRQLHSPCKDVELVGESIRQLERDRHISLVKIEVACNLKTDEMHTKLNELVGLLDEDQEAAALIYFAGHAAQADETAYLFGITFAFRSDDVLPNNGRRRFVGTHRAIALNDIVADIGDRTGGPAIIIVDACRTSPFDIRPGSPKQLASFVRGLSGPKHSQAPSTIGLYVSYSTTSGKPAQDGSPNSPYAAALARALIVPHRSLPAMFQSVRKEVFDLTNGDQKPADSTQLIHEFCFGGCTSTMNNSGTATGPISPVNTQANQAVLVGTNLASVTTLARPARHRDVGTGTDDRSSPAATRIEQALTHPASTRSMSIAQVQKSPGAINVYRLGNAFPNQEPVKVDVFWCEDQAGAIDRYQAAVAVSKRIADLASEQNSDQFPIAGIRLRPLPQRVNDLPGYAIVGRQIRLDANSSAEQETVKKLLGVLGAEYKSHRVVNRTPGYVSVFICDPPAAPEHELRK